MRICDRRPTTILALRLALPRARDGSDLSGPFVLQHSPLKLEPNGHCFPWERHLACALPLAQLSRRPQVRYIALFIQSLRPGAPASLARRKGGASSPDEFLAENGQKKILDTSRRTACIPRLHANRVTRPKSDLIVQPTNAPTRPYTMYVARVAFAGKHIIISPFWR